MKKKLIILTIALLAAASHAQNYSVTVTTNSTDLTPQARLITVNTWSNALVVAQGDYIVNTNTPPRKYWAVSGGTSTNMPSHTYGVATGADDIEWLYFNPEKRRKNAIIFADIAGTTYYTKDGQDATTAGSILDAVRPARAFPGKQGTIKAIVASGTATIDVELEY